MPLADPDLDLAQLAEGIVATARRAGDAILEVYASEAHERTKGDGSPVTLADDRAEAIILADLAQLGDIPAVSEEASARGERPEHGSRFWLVDPLDGTKEFLSRNGEFTVNIALIDDGVPVLGVVLAPALGSLYCGIPGNGAWTEDAGGRREIAVRDVPQEGLTVVASRSHGDPETLERFLAGRSVAAQRSAGSSLKFCLVAAGDADLYPRFGRTMEWDTAAGHGVLLAAGGAVSDVDGRPLTYGKNAFENPWFVASGDSRLLEHPGTNE